MLGFEKNRKIRSDDSRSESVTSDKIQAHSIDSNRSNSRGSSEGKVSSSDGGNNNNNHKTSNSSSSGHKISFKPYEDLPNKHRDEGKRSTFSPKRKDRSPSPSTSSRKTERSKSPESPNKHTSSSSHRLTSSSSVAHHSTSSESDKSKHQPDIQSQMSQHLKDKAKQLELQSQLSQQHHKIGSCRDPFCSGCQLSHLQNFLPSSSSCCSSFPQCVHAQAASHFASFPHPSLYGLSRFNNRPFLCHWTAGGSYCGKSFSSCEELLQHLKTHTLSSSAVNSSSFPGLGSYPHSSLLSGRHSSLDPLRYHPYKFNGHTTHQLGSQLRSPSVAHASSSLFSHQNHTSSLTSPSMTVFHPTQHPSLGSYYTLLN